MTFLAAKPTDTPRRKAPVAYLAFLKRSIVLPFTVSAVLLLITGCSGSDIEEFKDARALIDYESGSLVMPLDRFALTPMEQIEVERANAILVGECMAEQGLSFPRAASGAPIQEPLPERRYGLWVMEEAIANGYDLPEDPALDQLDQVEREFPDEWWAAMFACFNNDDQLPYMGPALSAERISVVAQGIVEANTSAQKDPEWIAARDEWVACMQNEGYSVQGGSEMIPVLSEVPEVRARTALVDVQCKTDNGTIAKLANIESRYQAQFISGRENELSAFRAESIQVLEQAREILERLG